MQTEFHSFEEWDYPFIAQDYEGEFNIKCSNAILAGAVLYDYDNLEDIVAFLQSCIKSKVPAIMVEMVHLTEPLTGEIFSKYIKNYLEEKGYKDLESYEHRLSYGKVWKN